MWGEFLFAVVADGFDRAGGDGFFAEKGFFFCFRLFEDDAVSAVVVAVEIGRGGLAAEVAVDALIVYVVFAGSVVGVFVFDVGHGAW